MFDRGTEARSWKSPVEKRSRLNDWLSLFLRLYFRSGRDVRKGNVHFNEASTKPILTMRRLPLSGNKRFKSTHIAVDEEVKENAEEMRTSVYIYSRRHCCSCERAQHYRFAFCRMQ